MRTVGRVKTTVQCVRDGRLLHFLPRATYGSRLPILPDRDPGATHYWSKRAEFNGHIIKMSAKDGKPRITNSNDGKKLQVGVWDNLDDPADHEPPPCDLGKPPKGSPRAGMHPMILLPAPRLFQLRVWRHATLQGLLQNGGSDTLHQNVEKLRTGPKGP